VEGSCEHGNEPSGSIKRWEVLEWLHNWQLLKKCSAPRVSGYCVCNIPHIRLNLGTIVASIQMDNNIVWYCKLTFN
jgi:hypothetical protein